MNPGYAQGRQGISDRERLFNVRLEEAGGGQTAFTMGYLTGLTAGWWTYTYLHKGGFSFLPYQRHKVGKYTMIFGAFFAFYQVGKGLVAGITSDPEQYRYLCINRQAIVMGDMPLERSHYRLSEKK